MQFTLYSPLAGMSRGCETVGRSNALAGSKLGCSEMGTVPRRTMVVDSAPGILERLGEALAARSQHALHSRCRGLGRRRWRTGQHEAIGGVDWHRQEALGLCTPRLPVPYVAHSLGRDVELCSEQRCGSGRLWPALRKEDGHGVLPRQPCFDTLG